MSWVWTLLWLASLYFLVNGSVPPPVETDPNQESSKARANVESGDGILYQERLNGSSSIVQCEQHPTWFRSWTDHMHVQYYEKACYDAWRRMRDVDVIPYGYEALEFLAVGVTPSWKVKPIESPRRYIGADGGKSCTITVAMLRDIPQGEFQRQPFGPWLPREIMSFKMLSLAVSDIFKDCISNSFTAAQGFGWARPGAKADRGILVLIMGSDSQVDRDIAEGVDFP